MVTGYATSVGAQLAAVEAFNHTYRTVAPVPQPGWPRRLFSHNVQAALLGDVAVVGFDPDRGIVWRFDRNGKDRTVGGRGTMAGQFNAPRTLVRLRPAEIGVWDAGAHKLVSVDAEGRVGQERQVTLHLPDVGGSREQLHVLGWLADGRLLGRIMPGRVGGLTSEVKPDSSRIVVISRNGRTARVVQQLPGEAYFVFRDMDPIVVDDVPFHPRWSVAVGTTSYYTVTGTSFEIVERSLDGTVLRTFGVERASRPLSADYVRRWKEARIRATPAILVASMAAALGRLPTGGAVEGYVDVMTDTPGNVWAAEQTVPGAAVRWHVYSRDGVPLGHVVTPPRSVVLWIGANAIVVASTIQAGIVEVRVHDLTPAAGSGL